MEATRAPKFQTEEDRKSASVPLDDSLGHLTLEERRGGCQRTKWKKAHVLIHFVNQESKGLSQMRPSFP
jgi:hypothetical protein